ncbi:MAG TPA: hypothetical protein VNG29_03075 [Candidatus Paceibacterota bacterium]|nr:hypothetical protein [Candidatus Paceibacterota bacterium]
MQFTVYFRVERKSVVIWKDDRGNGPKIVSSSLTNSSVIRDHIVIEAASQEEADKFAKKLLRQKALQLETRVVAVHGEEKDNAIRRANA